MRYQRTAHGLTPLGLIPSYQFSEDPAINFTKITHVQFPPGMYQTTPQPAYPYYQGPMGTEGEGPTSKPLGLTSFGSLSTGTKVALGVATAAAGWFAYHLFGKRRRRR